MAKSGKTPRELLAAKGDKLNWSLFNFLENLLVFCAMDTRSVPQESGVCFQISSKIKSDGICLLFEIDRKRDPLMLGAGVKPDYLAIHVTSDRCLCTIIEMKGRDEKNLEHGIEQIKALRDRLREEAREHLPTTCKFRFQGILLAPHNAQLPLPRLVKEERAGLKIVPIRYHQRAELYAYVRKENEIAESYQHQALPREKPELNYIETLLTQCALPVRIMAPSPKSPSVSARSGVHLSYARPDGLSDDHAALALTNDGTTIRAPASAKSFLDRIRSELGHLRLAWIKRIELSYR